MTRIFLFFGVLFFGSVNYCSAQGKVNPSAVITTQGENANVLQHRFAFVVSIHDTVYSGYSILGINDVSIIKMAIERGIFTLDSATYDTKINLELVENKTVYPLTLDHWAKQNISFEGELIFVINQEVLPIKPELILIDQHYILDYEVIPLPHLKLEKPVAVVKIRTKNMGNLEAKAILDIR